ncbi:MAG: response regulator [Minicystis sp.]
MRTRSSRPPPCSSASGTAWSPPRPGRRPCASCCRRTSPVLLLDVNMPGMDGFEIAQAARSLLRLESLPIIFLTATNQGSSDSLRGYETGAVDYVHVPVDPAILRAKVSAFVRMHRMTTEIRRQAGDLAKLNQQLTGLNEDLEAFSYSVSHDLRAPLRIISQYSAILADEQGARLDGEGNRLLGRIRANAAHMGQLIEALLQLSRVNRGSLALRDVDLSALAEEVVTGLRQQDPARTVTVGIQPGMRVQADPGLARTLLGNLLGNAWKYSAKRADAAIAMTCDQAAHPAGLHREGQRRRFRHGLRRQALRALPAPPPCQRFRGQRHRPVDRGAHHPPPRRQGLGRGGARRGRGLPLHDGALGVRRSMSGRKAVIRPISGSQAHQW